MNLARRAQIRRMNPRWWPLRVRQRFCSHPEETATVWGFTAPWPQYDYYCRRCKGMFRR